MDPMGEEPLDYGEDEYGGSQKSQFQGGGAISALAEEEMMGEDDEYDDLYNDVNVGEGFMQTLQQHPEPSAPFGKSAPPNQKTDVPRIGTSELGDSQNVSIPGVVEGMDVKTSSSYVAVEPRRSNFFPGKYPEEVIDNHPDGVSQKGRSGLDIPDGAQGGNMAFRGGSSVPIAPKVDVNPKFTSGPSSLPPDSGSGGFRSGPPVQMNQQPGLVGSRPTVNNTPRPPMGSMENSGPTMLFVGELHWWTTDAELESVLSQYGRVKEIKFFDERASGKSKGYCQVEFYDPAAAAACKEGMNGHVFNGRACVVAFASPQTLKQMGQSYMNKTQGQAQGQTQGRRLMNDGNGRGSVTNFQGGDGGRNNGRTGWGRGGQGLLNRGQGGAGAMRGRGPLGAKGMAGGGVGIGAGLAGGGPYGQGLGGPMLGGPAGGLMHPQSMMGTGFDPTYMNPSAAYGGFSGTAFPGMMPSFPGVNTVGLPGVAPHVNPAFFGRGMTANGMGMMGSSGMDANSTGMWTDTSMGRWTGEEHGRRTRESSYGGDDVASDYGHGDASHDRGGRSNVSREKDRGSERDWSGNSERRYHDDREQDWERSNKDRGREEKDGYRDHRQRDRDYENENDWDRGQSSLRSRSKSRMMQQEDDRPRTRDADYGKKRRVPSE